MKAFLLSGGKGSRLGDLVKKVPKPALLVNGESVIERWFHLFKESGISEVLINTSYLSEELIKASAHLIKKYSMKVTFTFEEPAFGTAGTINANREFIKGDRSFFVAYADTWMDLDIRKMIRFHKRHYGMVTMYLHKPKDLADQGVITIERGVITSIEEKPKNPKGALAFAGAAIVNVSALKFLDLESKDIMKDWFPKIVSSIDPFISNGVVLDIGTPERYARATEIVKGLGLKAL